MLITFKSAVSGDLIMHEKNGKEILVRLGKDPEAASGIITVEQLPAAIASLRAVLMPDNSGTAKHGNTAAATDEAADRISLAQRALPLLETLERALAGGKPVTWGV